MKLFDLIGNTPLVELQHIPTNKNIKIFGKLEGQNPGGSVRHGPADFMMTSALERVDSKSDDRLVEATSGNTGISMAMIAKIMKVKMTLIMPENATEERIKTVRAYAAE